MLGNRRDVGDASTYEHNPRTQPEPARIVFSHISLVEMLLNIYISYINNITINIYYIMPIYIYNSVKGRKKDEQSERDTEAASNRMRERKKTRQNDYS